MGERMEFEKVSQTFEVTLGGKPYTLRVRPMGEMAEFRRTLGELAGGVFGVLRDSGQMGKILGIFKGLADRQGTGDGFSVETLMELGLDEILPVALPWIISDGMTLLLRMLTEFAPSLEQAVRDADDDEIMTAAAEVLRVNFPLLVKRIKAVIGVLAHARQ